MFGLDSEYRGHECETIGDYVAEGMRYAPAVLGIIAIICGAYVNDRHREERAQAQAIVRKLPKELHHIKRITTPYLVDLAQRDCSATTWRAMSELERLGFSDASHAEIAKTHAVLCR